MKKRKRTWLSQREYKRRVNTCPWCGKGARVAIDDTNMAQHGRIDVSAECCSCGATWVDVYRFERYYVRNEGKK